MSESQAAVIWHNKNCSKSRGACDLLSVRGVDFETRDYIKNPPSRAEIESVLKMMGDPEPSAIVRFGEQEAKDLNLTKNSSRDEILDALVAHPKLIERPIVITSEGRAVVGRPPELVLDLFD